ncbi:MAG TPA: neutral zinc metallopeptidase [Sedimentibacter sp.]|nr:neutral zinc metallopeptidase [Sedimentibacter sp.]HOH68998.1 neutral zinc metallopeptidase [Sedimentibacter sp.]
MKWKGRRGSSNVQDRRGGGTSRGVVGGGIGTIILFVVVLLMGGDPSQLLGNSAFINPAPSQYVESEEENELAEFASVVLAETETVWDDLFEKEGLEYQYPTLVLYTDYVQSACGNATSQTGPFYCPGDNSVYIDLSFYEELKKNYKAPGDFAFAYVIAHEVGHHVQKQLGITDQVMGLRNRLSEKDFNQYMVRLELQADYFAGVWAHYVERANLLEKGDINEALNAASAVGDDRIQSEAWGYVVPDKFTHGTSEQRARWFYKGFESGTMQDGDTFNAKDL